MPGLHGVQIKFKGGRAMSSPVVLITGALTGIGRAAAIIFAQEGARIVVSGRRDKQGQELVAKLQGLGAEAIFVRTDVRRDEDVRNLVDQTVQRFGRLDIAVNNAGTEGLRGLVTEQTAESYADTFTRIPSRIFGGGSIPIRHPYHKRSLTEKHHPAYLPILRRNVCGLTLTTL